MRESKVISKTLFIVSHHACLLSLKNTDSQALKSQDPELYQSLFLKDVLVYCARGPRAEKVARALHNTRQKLSLSESLNLGPINKNDIYELVGGYSMWSR